MIDALWREEARCRGMNPGLFFSYSPASVRNARQACFGCPVFEECLKWCTDEIDIDEVPDGIIAGYTPSQRFRMAANMPVRDWREFFNNHPACSHCDDVMMTSSGYWVCHNCGYRWTKPRYQKPGVTRRKTEGEIEEREARRIAAKDVPPCPTCLSKKDITSRRRADGTKVFRHLPCGRNYTDQEAT